MSALATAAAIAKTAAAELIKLASRNPEALAAVGQTIKNIARSPNPREAARRAALATASEQASEAALKRILGRK
jgi:hypothetical protein